MTVVAPSSHTRAPLRARLASREPLLGTFVKSHDAALAEILAGAGFDFLVADLDHSSLGLRELEGIVRAASLSSVHVIVRLPPSEVAGAGRALDLGVTGIQLTDVTDADTVRAAKALASYPPEGRRSLALSTRAARFGREPVDLHLGRSASELVVVAQVESAEGVDALPELVESRAADAWFVGPLDLSLSLGRPGRSGDPAVVAVVDQAAETILAGGGRLGVFARDRHEAVAWRERGATLVVVASDYALLAAAADEIAGSWHWDGVSATVTTRGWSRQ